VKSRLTITLAEPLLKQIDQLIDGQKVRNRSHAIEQLLQQSLKPKITQAVILAGGQTDALREIPRALTMINDKPLIEHIIEHFQAAGVTKIVITSHHKGKQIEKLYADGKKLGVSILYHWEDKPMGTAGAIQSVKSLLDDKSFFVWAGDTFSDINLTDLTTFHLEHHLLATIAVKPIQPQQSYDSLILQGNTVIDFQPSQKNEPVGIINAGVYVFEPQIFSYLPLETPAMLEKTVFPTLTRQRQCAAFLFQGVWYDVSTEKNLQ